MEFIDFAVRNWYLFLALIVILALLIGGEIRHRLQGIGAVSPAEALRLMNHEDAVMLDVREASDYKTGHIPDALHIPQKELEGRLKELARVKDKPLIVYAAMAGHATACGVLLKKHGFAAVQTLKGGVTEWQNANLPITRK